MDLVSLSIHLSITSSELSLLY